MIPPHASINFKFNNESKIWFSIHGQEIIKHFDETFPEYGGPIFNNPDKIVSINFQSSPPALQVKKFLEELGLTNTYVQIFVYKIRSKLISIENPHIDTPGGKMLPGRFNVLVYGNEHSKMHWWNKDITDSVVQHIDIPNFGKRWQITGNSTKEQLNLLGESDYSVNTLSRIDQTGDFVRTDIVHSIERDRERRLIVSVRIYHPWEEIYEKVNKTLTI
jgi:hypothetical protein